MSKDKEMHSVENPLKLVWRDSQYKVNKPNQDTQELVSLEYAKDLLKAKSELLVGLKMLWDTKKLKDASGKSPTYEKMRDRAWKRTEELITKYP